MVRGAEKLFFVSDTGVAIVRRRVLKQTTIQPSNKPTDAKPGKRIGQYHIPHPSVRPTYVTELLLLIIAVVIPVSVHAGIFSELFTQASTTTPIVEIVPSDSPSDIPLLTATQNPDPQGGTGEADVMVKEDALMATGPVDSSDIAAQHNNVSDEITVYTVREGDSLSEVAEMFGVTANTILWANNLSKSTGIHADQELVILPIAGVRHVVKSGDTLASIAKKYDGDTKDILAFNQLASAEEVRVGDTIIIPGGEVRVETPKAEPKKVTKKPAKGKSSPASKGGKGTGSGGLINPAPGAIKTQGIHGHNGVDLGGAMGSTIRAAAAGQVIVAKADGGWNGGYGNYVVIKHANGTQTLYAHLSSLSVGVGDAVAQGETIGGMGNSGKSTGIHLHFEVRGGRNPF